MKNVDIAFSALEDDEAIPVGHQRINCHMIFNVKVGSLKRKARLWLVAIQQMRQQQ
jgi:hypothetical protein